MLNRVQTFPAKYRASGVQDANDITIARSMEFCPVAKQSQEARHAVLKRVKMKPSPYRGPNQMVYEVESAYGFEYEELGSFQLIGFGNL